MGEDDTPRDISRLTVPQAARQLGISPEAVRNRLSRGTLNSIKESGTVYVLLQTDRTRHTDDIPNDIPEALVVEMRGRIESLERQLEQANERDRENRRIIAALTSRIPELPPATPGGSIEPRPSPGQATPSPAGQVAPDARDGMADEEQRHFWRQVRRTGFLSFIFVLWVLSIGGVGLIPLLVPSFPTSQVRSGWGNAWLAVFLVPIVFGYVYGAFRPPRWARGALTQGRIPPFVQLVYVALVTGVGAAIVSLTLIGFVYNSSRAGVPLDVALLYEVVPALGLLLATTFFVLSTMLIGVARSRKREGQRGVAASPAPDGAHPTTWSPRQQAIIGLVGTTITALLTFIGVVIQVLAGKGGG